MPTSFDGYAEKVESLTSVFREFASRGLNGGSACGHGLSLFWTSNGRSRLVSPTGRVHDVPGRERSWYLVLWTLKTSHLERALGIHARYLL